MLNHIHIKNFAIVDDLELELKSGMTVLTGETGAGKSIIIDAIEIALGQRASSNMIRHGALRAEISISFQVTKIPAAADWLKAHELDHDDECILRRTINKDGRSKCFINGSPINLQAARQLGERLINIHGQHEFQTLLKPELQRDLLDEFAKHSTLVETVQSLFQHWLSIKKQSDHLTQQNNDSTARIEFLTYQLKELTELNITKDEIEQLSQEQKELANAETLLQNSQTAASLLQQDDKNVLDQLTSAQQHIDAIKNLHPILNNAAELINSAMINSEEAFNEIHHYLEHIELNPERLNFVEQRLSKTHELARKHRIKMDVLPELQQKMQTELSQLENSDDAIAELEAEVQTSATAYFTAARKLSSSRTKAAKKLSTLIVENMQQLGMPGGMLEIQLHSLSSTPPALSSQRRLGSSQLKPLDPSLRWDDKAQVWSDKVSVRDDSINPQPHGMEKIGFAVSANPGQPLQALNRVASGGELSRISLAIQVITAQHSNTPTLVFDEVDVGIGGATADIVGSLLRTLSEATQVLCITHLAQVASKGHQHLQVLKTTENNKTQTKIIELCTENRIKEIARMSGGVNITDETLAHAKTMLAETS